VPELTSYERAFDRTIDWISSRAHTPIVSWLLILTLLSWLLIFFISYREPDPDLFTRIAIGQFIEKNQYIPRVDPFAFSETKEIWHDHELVPAFLFDKLSSFGGAGALFFAKLLFCLVTIIIVHRAQSVYSQQDLFSFAILSICIIASHVVWLSTIRAQVITYLSFAYLLYAFSRYKERRGVIPLLLVPLVMLVWVNSHGGFVVGLGALGLFVATQALRGINRQLWAPLAALVLSLLSLLVNPYGVSFLWFIYDALTNKPDFVPIDPPYVIPEWLPPDLGSVAQLLPIFLIATILFGVYKKRNLLTLEGAGLMAMGAYGGFNHERFMPFFYLAVAVYGEQPLRAAYIELKAHAYSVVMLLRRVFFIFGSLATIAGCGAWFIFVSHCITGFSFTMDQWPVDAIDWLTHERKHGNVLTHYDVGTYVLYRGFPRFKVSLDGRFDGAYPLHTMDTAMAAITCEHRRHVTALEQLSPDFIVAESATYERHTARGDTCYPGYVRAFRGETYSIFERSEGISR
jgi:hypothetical protein